MAGDREYGVGSRNQGILKYGGTWRQDMHSIYATVCITIESYILQACIHCFNKLTHAKSRTIKQGTAAY
ncbi:hypothetical protein EDC96DRAFT_438600 [Choanephora cucurbitarum]|nr:hypothetical protein EDC96DRAFT_438600 [Choanephora cucurbitarum]